MLKIGQRMKADDFSKEIVPGVVRCFKSTDRATRIGLLQNMHTFAEHLTPALVENDVFPNLSSGFSDSVPALRELFLCPSVYYNGLLYIYIHTKRRGPKSVIELI